ncbi:uncharacterized protein MYCFIDRAFT_171680 [Pseudocercospora fijiensis CIRAD86]|uniref:Uncharacterized protein n=1 Tax=Pseudocercospora fijiensis (strain CIRAD86) TaxID=383855 RepID=M3AML3_PSEFD|nr:uncharacterized protein MYCFIDRAFT_171680 [Pseudocercospora fijiensis CIRAD86]EME85811.1 hypothetical protein MYCFIDRAFT_171680 [Pseudocercospora fijiensis CIRAD86]
MWWCRGERLKEKRPQCGSKDAPSQKTRTIALVALARNPRKSTTAHLQISPTSTLRHSIAARTAMTGAREVKVALSKVSVRPVTESEYQNTQGQVLQGDSPFPLNVVGSEDTVHYPRRRVGDEVRICQSEHDEVKLGSKDKCQKHDSGRTILPGSIGSILRAENDNGGDMNKHFHNLVSNFHSSKKKLTKKEDCHRCIPSCPMRAGFEPTPPKRIDYNQWIFNVNMLEFLTHGASASRCAHVYAPETLKRATSVPLL